MPKLAECYVPDHATDAADAVYRNKDPRYASRWREYEIISLSDVALSKARRVKQAILDDDYDDALEETVDAINYLRFLWCKLMERAG